MKKISFIFAMEAEADELIRALKLKKITPHPFYENSPILFYRGSYKDKLDITVSIPGKDPRYHVDSIGTEPAAVTSFACIREFQPDVLVNAGTAGSFAKNGASIGKVYLSHSAFYFHDHRIPIKGWEQFGLGNYPSIDVEILARELNCERANISSGNSLDFTQADLDRIEKSGAGLKEMEACGIAWVASHTKTPFFAIKSVTNLIDVNSDSPAEFEKNFDIAVDALTAKTLSMIEILASQNWAELGFGDF